MILIADLIAVASKLTGYSIDEIKGPSKTKPMTVVRSVIACIARNDNPLRNSYPVIAKRIGRKDHSTIINLIDNQDIYRATCPEYDVLHDAVMAAVSSMDSFQIAAWKPEAKILLTFPISARNFEVTQANKNRRRRDRRREERERCAAIKAITQPISAPVVPEVDPLDDDPAYDSVWTHRWRMRVGSENFRKALLAA